MSALGSGLIALSWQELIATVIPITHRSRFFGFSRVVGQTMGIIGSDVRADPHGYSPVVRGRAVR